MHSLYNKYLLIYLFTITIVSCGRSQRAAIQLSGNAQSDILLMLKEGKHPADIMDGVKQTPQQAAISQKLEKAFQENYAWFTEYVKTVPPGDPLPYNEKMGISKNEYELFLGGNAEIVSSGKETLEIEQHEQVISFKGTGRLIVFDSVKIDLPNKVATFRGYKLATMDTVSVTDANNGLKSRWKGYGFSFDESNNFIPKTLGEIAGYNHTSFKLTIGLLEKGNKIMLDFAGNKVVAGKKLIEIRVPAVFD